MPASLPPSLPPNTPSSPRASLNLPPCTTRKGTHGSLATLFSAVLFSFLSHFYFFLTFILRITFFSIWFTSYYSSSSSFSSSLLAILFLVPSSLTVSSTFSFMWHTQLYYSNKGERSLRRERKGPGNLSPPSSLQRSTTFCCWFTSSCLTPPQP